MERSKINSVLDIPVSSLYTTLPRNLRDLVEIEFYQEQFNREHPDRNLQVPNKPWNPSWYAGKTIDSEEGPSWDVVTEREKKIYSEIFGQPWIPGSIRTFTSKSIEKRNSPHDINYVHSYFFSQGELSATSGGTESRDAYVRNAYVRNAHISRILQKTPSIGWFLANTNRFHRLPREDRKLINDYANRGFRYMNYALRANPDQVAPINGMIEKMIPTKKPITVFRSVRNDKFLPKEPGNFTSYGYLSTTIDPRLGSKCKEKTPILLRIHIPVGKKAIWLYGWEAELLFQHNIPMRVNWIRDMDLPCSSNSNSGMEVHEYKVYDMDML